MAEHFRSFRDDIDVWADPILHPEEDRVHQFLTKHGEDMLQLMGAERLPDTSDGQLWRFHSESNVAAVEIAEPEVVIPAILRRGDLGLFYTWTADEEPLWRPIPGKTSMDRSADSGNPEADSLVILGETLHASTRRVRSLGRLIDNVAVAVRDPLARRRWRMSTERTKAEIAAHYDLSPEIYTGEHGFLDPNVQYSSGLLLPGSEFTSLEDLQKTKMASLERKLALDEADTLLEVGGGWGGFAIRVASDYPNLHVTSLTVSDEQLKIARQRAIEAGVADRVTFLGVDYRDLHTSRRFDRVVSVEMIEAVDWRDLDVYLQSLIDFVDPEKGIIVLQSINVSPRDFPHQRHHTGFVNMAIFPGGVLTPKEVVSSRMADRGWRTYEETDLTSSYALTLREWIRNLSANQPALTKIFEAKGIPREKIDRFYRGFKFYFAMAQAGFRPEVGHIFDTQQTFVPESR